MQWQDAIRLNSESFQGFNDFLDRLKAQAQREQDEATSWDAAKEAVGKKKAVDIIRQAVTMTTREEQAYERAFGHTDAHARTGG